MATRISISDAPLAVLGQAGIEQNMAVASKDAAGKVTPQRTTVAAMAAYIGAGDMPAVPQIQAFVVQGNPAVVYDAPAGTPSNGNGPEVVVPVSSGNRIVWSGDESYYRVIEGDIVTTEAGIYNLTVVLAANYASTTPSRQHRWKFNMDITTPSGTDSVEGPYERPRVTDNDAEPTLAQANITFRSTANGRIRTRLRVQNIGQGNSIDPALERWTLLDIGRPKRCLWTISRVA